MNKFHSFCRIEEIVPRTFPRVAGAPSGSALLSNNVIDLFEAPCREPCRVPCRVTVIPCLGCEHIEHIQKNFDFNLNHSIIIKLVMGIKVQHGEYSH